MQCKNDCLVFASKMAATAIIGQNLKISSCPRFWVWYAAVWMLAKQCMVDS